MKNFVTKKDFIKDIAIQRIDILFKMAEEVYRKDQRLANRYVELAYLIALRARVRIPKKYKYRICKKCRTYLVPGKTLSVRLRSRREPHIIMKCTTCGYIRRIPYKKVLKTLNKKTISSGES
ncbi:MAG: hypothetical protein J7K23_01540 [Thermoproteales archaeon]|nr:hypothetical protein [Thermoproteales archaeon]